ncbi:type II secretion system F family protein [Microbacterium gorillae]|uniref:type II secretion system F family protein n=1 Tax=Microbacterium gorillae TaxID=1231063 RepID=UPI000590169F|nr:type II secretion system F family protein [Microbacterium gorillae]
MTARRDRDAAVATREAADTARRIAVLLHAGIVPERAWTYVGEVDGGAVATISARMSGGARPADAIEAQGGPWVPLAAAWRIAEAVGAPLADTLRAIAGALQDGSETADDVTVALAEPTVTARIMLWLPVLGLLLGAVLGFDTIGVLIGNPLGITCLIAGIGLVVLARQWTRRLVRRARDLPIAPGLRAELAAVALSGGATIDRALRLVDDALGQDEDAAVERVLALSRRAGVPAAALLRASAADARQRTRTEGRIRAVRLGSAMLLPLGLCTLPAFFLLGVAPMVLSVITSTQLAW